MPRKRRDFKRKSDVRDASLIVIACEGAATEPKYFNGLKERQHIPRIHVEVLQREIPENSSPPAVLEMLKKFYRKYRLQEGDQLWLVIDRDRQSWEEAAISKVARECRQSGYFMALSNPCFELWLLLHFEDVEDKGKQYCDRLFANANGFLKQQVGKYMRANTEYIDHFFPNTQKAIVRAGKLDREQTDRWPQGLGTHVYRLVKHFFLRSECP